MTTHVPRFSVIFQILTPFVLAKLAISRTWVDSVWPNGIVNDCSLSLNTAWVQMRLKVCEKVASDLCDLIVDVLSAGNTIFSVIRNRFLQFSLQMIDKKTQWSNLQTPNPLHQLSFKSGVVCPDGSAI